MGDSAKKDDAPIPDDKGTFSGAANPGDQGKKAADPSDTSGSKVNNAQPALVKVRVGNETIETDVASAAFMNAMMGQIQILNEQVQKQGKPVDDKKNKKDDAYDYSTGLFTETQVALDKLRAEIKAEVKAEMTGAYTAAETQKEFWSSFYEENKDLKGEKMLVNAILSHHYSKLSNLPVADAAKELSTLVKKELLRLSGGKSDSDSTNTAIEGGSTRKSAPSGGQGDSGKILSLSDIVRKRQEARRKATYVKE